MNEDPYTVLGVPKDASAGEIKKAYKQKAMQYHPDKQTGDNKAHAEEMFCKVNNAHDILSDNEKRRMHDMGIPEGMQGGMQGEDIFGHMFSSMFSGMGMNRQQQQTPRKNIYEININITLSDVVHGCEKNTQSIKIVTKCTKCEGTGLDAPKDMVKCTTCGGVGMRIQQMGPGMMIQSTCHVCLGKGSISNSKKVCGMCNGRINVQSEKKFNVKIPKGLLNKSIIRLETTDSYDINANINYIIDEGMQVNNQDVHIHLPPLTLKELLCGFTRKIDLYGKTISLKTSGYFNPDKPKKLEGRGLPFPNDSSKCGNAIVHYKINYTDMNNLNDHIDDFKRIFTNEL